MSVEAEESLLGPDETGETEPHLTLVPDPDTTLADAAAYAAKSSGRDRWVRAPQGKTGRGRHKAA